MSSDLANYQEEIQKRSDAAKFLDVGFVWLTRAFALGVAAILLLIASQVTVAALPAIKAFGFSFFTETDWDPIKSSYGALPQIYGTLVSAFIGLLIAVPIGIGVAVFLSEDFAFLPRKFQGVLVFLVELLAAIPSVVYGLWGIFVLIPILREVGKFLNASFGWIPIFSTAPSGVGMLPAGVILAIMILPTITVISRESLISLSNDMRQASMGLGATRWETIIKVLLPASFSGIVGAIMLALGRAMGETMAVTMLIGNSNRISASILAPANTISSLLANQFAEADGLQVAALMYAALVLFGLTLVVNIFAELLIIQVQKIK